MKLLFAFSLATLLSSNMPELKNSGISDSANMKLVNGEEKPLLRFGIIADVQYADCPSAGNRYYRSSAEKLEAAVSQFKKDSVDFIINLGDLIDRDYESYKPVLGILNSSGIKTYHITGNHDYSVDPRYLLRLPVFTESREGYYSIIFKKFRFIFTNGNDISTYSSNEKTEIRHAEELIAKMKMNREINAVEWNGGIGPEQLAWIKNQLDEAADNSEKVILLCHFPIAPENTHNLLNYKVFNDMLMKYTNIIGWFSGHNHEGNYASLNNIHFVSFRGMVETKKDNSFAIIEAYKDKLIIKGYGRENSMVLNF